MKKNRKSHRRHEYAPAADATIILGDLTDLTHISRSGATIILHGRENPRTLDLPNEQLAHQVWTALAKEAGSAVEDDRQFFCVSIGDAYCPEENGTLQ